MNRKGLVEAAFDDALQRLGMSAWAKQQHVMPSTGQKKLLLDVMDSAQEVRRSLFGEKVAAGHIPLDE